MKSKMGPFLDHLDIFISAYRKSYSSSHILTRLIENWKQSLDNQKFVGVVLMAFQKPLTVSMLMVLALIHLKYFFL